MNESLPSTKRRCDPIGLCFKVVRKGNWITGASYFAQEMFTDHYKRHRNVFERRNIKQEEIEISNCILEHAAEDIRKIF